jgi:hypothetical protein
MALRTRFQASLAGESFVLAGVPTGRFPAMVTLAIGLLAGSLGGRPTVAEAPTAAEVVATFDADGLAGLTVGGVPLLAPGTPRVTLVRSAAEPRHPARMADPYVADTREFADESVDEVSHTCDAEQRVVQRSYPWGAIKVTYTAGPGRLDLRVAIANESRRSLERVAIDLLAVTVPPEAAVGGAASNLGFPALTGILPRVTRFQRAKFPAAPAAADDLLPELDADTPATVEIMCPACYAKATKEHLMETGQKVEPIDLVMEGVCRRCQAETRLPSEPLIVATSLQADRPVMLAWEQRQPGTAVLVATIGDAPAKEVFDGVWNARSVEPGATDSFDVGLRFGRADEQPQALAADAFAAYAKAVPQQLRWPDRRPISMAHLCFDKGPDRNPRGWWGFKDTTDDIRTPEGLAAFEKWLMGYADQLIAVADKAGSQGVVIWDLEGKQFPGQTYYGDPRVTKYTAPEMEPLADAFCQRLRDAGLRVGMCLRPTHLDPRVGQPPSWDAFDAGSFDPQFEHEDERGLAGPATLADLDRSPVARLDAKIRACKERWGATLFYIDTNYFVRARRKSQPNAAGGFDELAAVDRLLMRAEDWEELQRRHPDVLLIPEHEYPRYWASTAPYRQPPYDGPTPAEIRALYPESFAAIALNGDAAEHVARDPATYVAAVERGDLLMIPGWYGPPQVAVDVYAAAAATAPLRATVEADGRIRLGDEEAADAAAFEKRLAAAVEGRPFAARRMFVRYAPASSRPGRAAAIAAVERAGGIVAWSQPMATGAGER